MSYDIGIIVDHELLGLTSNYAVLLLITSLIFFSAGHSRIFQGIDDTLTTEQSKLPEVFEPEKIQKIEKHNVLTIFYTFFMFFFIPFFFVF